MEITEVNTINPQVRQESSNGFLKKCWECCETIFTIPTLLTKEKKN